MSRNVFDFEGGEYLTSIGAAWFISYHYYMCGYTEHLEWKRVSSYKYRISRYNVSSKYHSFWVDKICEMNPSKLATNSIGLSGDEIIMLANKLRAARAQAAIE